MKSNNLLRYAFCVLFSCMLMGIFGGVAKANNIRIIGKPIITDQDTLKNTVLIKFDLAWDNSWKTSKPENHDAAWIFVKCWDGESWNHVYLEDNTTDKSFKPGSTVASDAVNKGVVYSVTDREGKIKNMTMVLEPGYSYAWKKWHLDPAEDSVKCVVGYFLYRQNFGAGHVVVPGITFKWNYGNQGFVDDDDLVVKVFAVEMVYVPQGAYYLGGKGNATWQYGSFTTNGNTFGTPMVIQSEGSIAVSKSADSKTLWANNDQITEGVIPAAYPKGYGAFYIMKYEMTQEAYCEFLNTLNQGQQDGRIEGTLANLAVGAYAWGSDLSAYRNYIRIKQAAPTAIFGMNANNNAVFDETDKVKYDDRDTLVRNIDGQDLAVNFVSMNDLLAYAEFAGLRPMTELEYEKACRGPREPVNDEYAWGSVTKVFFGSAFSGAGAYFSWSTNLNGFVDHNTGTEHVGDAYNVGFAKGYTYANQTWWNSWSGGRQWIYPAPLRVGIFADSTSTRAASGATFWGVMNMSDNVAEMCISAYDSIGRKFEGTHGCGQLDGNGDAINAGWHHRVESAISPRYYAFRGMIFPYYYINQTTAWGNRWAVNEITTNDGQATANYWAGMISSRYRANNHGIVMSQRNYTASGADGMRGIRCVRTDKATR